MSLRVHLFSGRVVELEPRDGLSSRRSGAAPGARGAAETPLFAVARALFASGDVKIRERGAVVDVASLPLADFHALRAIATKKGWLDEEPLELSCKNCDGELIHAPCSALALGPFVSGDLDDDELDVPLDLSRPHPIPEVRLDEGGDAAGRPQAAREVRLAPRTLGEATPLHRALGRTARPDAPTRGERLVEPRLDVTEEVIRAMGIVALGEETRTANMTRALRAASDEAFEAICGWFLLAHYPARLFSIARCPACGARNDVDAPYDREFEVPETPLREGDEEPSNQEDFPDFEGFSERARVLAAPILEAHPGVLLVVDDGVPICDDGGEPLLGSYVPESLGGPGEPPSRPEVTLFYRTFGAVWDEEGPYDWAAEVRETLEHEIEHHVAYLAGDDPMDEEERRAIDREAERVHGKRALLGAEASALTAGAADFARRTWPIWLILAVATIAATLLER